jgi:hypothetical protein
MIRQQNGPRFQRVKENPVAIHTRGLIVIMYNSMLSFPCEGDVKGWSCLHSNLKFCVCINEANRCQKSKRTSKIINEVRLNYFSTMYIFELSTKFGLNIRSYVNFYTKNFQRSSFVQNCNEKI